MREDMTRVWWDMLPEAYRVADGMGAEGEPGGAGPEWPLYRFMSGAGSLLSDVQEKLDAVDAGALVTSTDRSTFAELRWLAQLLGVRVGDLSWSGLRIALKTRLENGAPYVGTRQHIGLAAKYALGEETQLAVYPDPDVPWTIYVLTDEAHLSAAGGRAAVVAKIAQYGAVPAGFKVIPVAARATWDQYDGTIASAGGQWSDFMRLVRTWAEDDSLGVQIPNDAG